MGFKSIFNYRSKENADNNVIERYKTLIANAPRVFLLFVTASVLCASVLRFVLEPQDNNRCHGMLNDGKWMTEEYKTWQPSGCMAQSYGRSEINKCFNQSRIIYIGDSIMREQYYAMIELIKSNNHRKRAIHADQLVYFEEQKTTVEMWWDPYLNTTKTIELFQGNPPNNTDKPSLLIVGAGIWHMRRLENNYLKEWKEALDRVFDGAIHNHIADSLMVSPVETVEREFLIPDRVRTLTTDKISIMNNYLRERSTFLESVTPLVVPYVWNEIVVSSKNQTEDGLHFKSPVTTAQAQLALNYHCNGQVIDKNIFPMEHTCCFTYPKPFWYQSFIFIFFLFLVPLAAFVMYTCSGRLWDTVCPIFPSSPQTIAALFVFGLSVIYMFLGDRSQLFGKMYKQYDEFTFATLISIMTILGLVTLKSNHKDKKDAGFLNRDQTDEWKGWMQLAILIYHFMGASRVAGIYNPVRILVAAYLFQTGYGHFFYFYKKADFGIARILNVMVRLNLLTCVLAYSMKTNYLFYYFSPLVSFWFGIIWLTMRVLPSHNSRSWFILIKIVAMAAITGFIIHCPGVLETVFNALDWLFKIHWDAVEWRFRLSLDAWIVYVGMLTAFATIKLNESKIAPNYPYFWMLVKYVSLVLSIVTMIAFFWFELSQTKQSYTVYHPYISWAPIVSFIVIRNFTRFGRNTYSRFFAFIGKISLETFIGQFHMWLAADTKGLLIVLPNASWVIKSQTGWWANLIVSSVVFVFVCYHLSLATGTLTKWICSGAVTNETPSQPTYTKIETSHSETAENYTSVEELNADSSPLLPTSANSTLPKNHKDEDQTFEPATVEVKRTSEDSAIIFDSTSDETIEQNESLLHYRLYNFITQNYWIRTGFYLVLMGLVNRLCA